MGKMRGEVGKAGGPPSGKSPLYKQSFLILPIMPMPKTADAVVRTTPTTPTYLTETKTFVFLITATPQKLSSRTGLRF